MIQILVATKNPNKVAEIQSILGDGVVLRPLPTEAPEVDEDGTTFEENARKKVDQYASYAEPGEIVIAEDSGLVVDALGGAPGIFSARYAGPDGDARANNDKLLRELAGKSDRSAAFVCTMICRHDGGEDVLLGEVRGRIADRPRGDSGFGYDPLFIPEGFDRTFAEMPPAEKNRMSHRFAALEKLKDLLPTLS